MNYCDKEKEFYNIIDNIENEFNEYFIESYSITSAGIHFIIYLNKEL